MKTDLEYLIEMTDNNKEVIIEMIDIFIEQVEEFENEMRTLLKNKDYKALGQLSHKSKSSVAIFGMKELSMKLKELEIMAMKGTKPQLYKSFIDNYHDECIEAIEELKDYKKNIH